MAEAEERLNAYYRQQQEAALVRRSARRRSANLPGLDVPAYVTAADLIDEAATWGIRPSAATAVVAETLDQVLAAIPATPGSWSSSASKPNESGREPAVKQMF
jgi:hypothetical protein